MSKYTLTRPALIMLYGFPGSGKTYFARQLAESLNAVHLQSDRVRYELFEQPRHDKAEDDIIAQLMQYMSEEFLRVGVSVIYDADVTRSARRREVRQVAHDAKAYPLMVWIQIDIESSFARVVKRDRRKTDDKYAIPLDRASYEAEIANMQNPTMTEDYVVISGKHNYQTQQNAVMKKLYDAGLVSAQTAHSTMVKPGLVNLIPNQTGGRVDATRRNINIR